MPHIPRSRLTEKDMKHVMNYVQDSALDEASAALHGAMEDEKRRIRAYKELKIKEILLDKITNQIELIKKHGKSEMYIIVEELCNSNVMTDVVSRAKDAIALTDGNPNNERKINPTNMDLTKTIEREYNLYMIELLVRSEVISMERQGVSTEEIVNILNLLKKNDFEARGKALRLRIRAVVKQLYGVPDKEQRIDKLREETRGVMRTVAGEVERKAKEEQNLIIAGKSDKAESISQIPNSVSGNTSPGAWNR